jgi:hypothetical protein
MSLHGVLQAELKSRPEVVNLSPRLQDLQSCVPDEEGNVPLPENTPEEAIMVLRCFRGVDF